MLRARRRARARVDDNLKNAMMVGNFFWWLILKLTDAQCRITTNKPQYTLFVGTLGQNKAILDSK